MDIKAKWIIPILVVALVAMTGCSSGRDSQAASQHYPHILYWNSSYRFDQYNRFIEVRDGFLLDEGHTFDIVETECGYDLILHFVKEVRENAD